MTFIDWVDTNLPRIKERLKTKKKAKRQWPSGISTCVYRVDGDPNNMAPENCCFIGYCIAPEHYNPRMDARTSDTSVAALVEIYPEAFGGLVNDATRAEIDLLMDLQNIHDSFKPEQWDTEFADWLDAYQTYKQGLTAPRG